MNLSLPKVMPWHDWVEWRCVYDAVNEAVCNGNLSENVVTFLDAKLLEWNQRGNVPFPVSITIQLLSQLLETEKSHYISDGRDVHKLSILILKLVNSIADSGQTGMHASSVAELARRAGLPRWFVDLRHDITHGSVPQHPVLRLAASTALQWLYQRYWKPQAENVDNSSGMVCISDDIDVEAMLTAYKTASSKFSFLEASLASNVMDAERALTAAKTLSKEKSKLEIARAEGKGTAGNRKRIRESQELVDSIEEKFNSSAAKANGNLIFFCPHYLESQTSLLATNDHLFPLPRFLLPGYECHTVSASPDTPTSQQHFPLKNVPSLDPEVTNTCASFFLPLLSHMSSPSRRYFFLRNSVLTPICASSSYVLPHPSLPQRPIEDKEFRRTLLQWLPLLYYCQAFYPGTTRILVSLLFTEIVKTQQGTSRRYQCQRWLDFLFSRYWYALFDWNLALSPPIEGGWTSNKRCRRLLWQQPVWSPREWELMHSPATITSLLGYINTIPKENDDKFKENTIFSLKDNLLSAFLPDSEKAILDLLAYFLGSSPDHLQLLGPIASEIANVLIKSNSSGEMLRNSMLSTITDPLPIHSNQQTVAEQHQSFIQKLSVHTPSSTLSLATNEAIPLDDGAPRHDFGIQLRPSPQMEAIEPKMIVPESAPMPIEVAELELDLESLEALVSREGEGELSLEALEKLLDSKTSPPLGEEPVINEEGQLTDIESSSSEASIPTFDQSLLPSSIKFAGTLMSNHASIPDLTPSLIPPESSRFVSNDSHCSYSSPTAPVFAPVLDNMDTGCPRWTL